MKRIVRNSPKREREGAVETNGGHKRAKLLTSDVAHEHPMDVLKAKFLDVPQNEVLDSYNHDDQIPILSKNMESEIHSSSVSSEMKEPTEQMSSPPNGNGSIQIHDDDVAPEQNSIIIQNGIFEEGIAKTSSESSIVFESPHQPESNSIVISEPPQSNEDSVQMPVLNPVNLEVRNGGDSTDSFQSEGFVTMNNANEAENKNSEHSFQSEEFATINNTNEAENKDSEQCFLSPEEVEPSPIHILVVENERLDQTAAQEEEESRAVLEPVSKSKKTHKTVEFLDSSEEILTRSLDINNIHSANLEVTQLEGHSEVIFSVAADEDFVLSSSGDTTVKAWSMVDKSIICNFSGHNDSVTSVLLLTPSQSDGLKSKLKLGNDVSRIAITGSLDCNIKLWSVFEGRELASVYTFNGITCLEYLESECLVVVGTEGGKIELWDISSSKAVQSSQAHEESVSDIKVVDCNIYTVSTDGTVIIWLYEDEDMYAVYTRKRKRDQDLNPSQWKSVTVVDNLIYLGDKSNSIKVLDSRAGRLRHFRNQNQLDGICECIKADKDLLLSSFYDPDTDTGGVNVWKIPELKYICTLTGDMQDVCSLALLRKGNFLRIVTGGHQLLVWDFDFSKPTQSSSRTKDAYYITELARCGQEIVKQCKERIHEIRQENPEENTNNKWCSVM